jgi:outer membrane immunogenic protein
MRCVRVALSVLGAAALTASSALASDLALPPPSPVPPIWGFYVGGGVCYDWANFDLKFNESYTDPNFTTVNTDNRDISNFNQSTYPSIGASGWCGTAIVGYDWQVSQNFILGVFADFDFQNKKGEFRH